MSKDNLLDRNKVPELDPLKVMNRLTEADIKNYSYEKIANQIAEHYGINLKDASIKRSNFSQHGLEKAKFNKAIKVAKEAQIVQFTRQGTNEELISEAKRLIEDYEKFIEPVVKKGESDVADYSERREAKILLIESLTRELSTRLGCGNGENVNSIRELSRQTGVNFSKVVRGKYPSQKQKEENPEGRMPKIGANGIWKTPGGDVAGTVKAGRKGGPYTIQTPKGKIQVDNIL